MTPTEILGSLLSTRYDGALAPEHLADLRKSGLTDETIEAQFIRSVPPDLIPGLLGFNVPGIRSALLFPFRSPSGGFMDLARVKVFPPLKDRRGHALKYLQPRGTSPRLYFVASCIDEVMHGDGPLWLVEGEKKALAVGQAGNAAVGFCGIEGWHRAGSRTLLPDFDSINLRRLVKVTPDGDYKINPNVERGTWDLGLAVEDRGATVWIMKVPGTGGIDEWLAGRKDTT